MLHINYIFIALIARSFELDKLVLDLTRAFVVEFVVAKLIRKAEQEG